MKSIQDLIGMTVAIAGVSLALSTMPGNVSAQTATVAINAAEMHQTIDGFGGAQPGGIPTKSPSKIAPRGSSIRRARPFHTAVRSWTCSSQHRRALA